MKLVIILPEYRDLAGPLFEQSSHMGAKQSTWSNGASVTTSLWFPLVSSKPAMLGQIQ